MPRFALHLVPAGTWASVGDGPYRPASLATDGFVHLTMRLDDLVAVANAFYQADPGPHVVLTIDLDATGSPWRIDADPRYPHVYGPIDVAAVVEVRAMPRAADGRFLAPRERAPRRNVTRDAPPRRR